MNVFDESFHLYSHEHKQRAKKQYIWCEDCDKYISDERPFQIEIHTLRYTFKCQYSNMKENNRIFDKLLEVTPSKISDRVINFLHTQSWFIPWIRSNLKTK